MKITQDGRVMGDHEHKVEMALQRLKAFEPPDGYYVAFSGGKDSQCVLHLCKMAGVKFDAHYAMTSVDPPELIWFIREHYPDVEFTRQHYSDGKPEHYYKDGRPKPITMWSLIADHTLPPTRKVRYCCAALKEPGGVSRIVVTGVRWAESANRRNTHGVANVQGKPKTTRKLADDMGAEYKLNKQGEVIMNDDNDANRRMMEQCYRTQKTMVNPIVDWTDKDVWDFLNKNGIPHCSLYDEGYTRLGCIGCPLAGTREMLRGFERYPKYKENYIRAFQRMIDRHPGQIRILDPEAETKFKLDVNAVEPENIWGGVSAERSEAEGASAGAKRQDAPETRDQGGADRRGAIFGIGSTSAIDGDDAPEVNGTEIRGGVYRTEHTSGMRTRRWDGICTDGAWKCFMFFLTNCNG